MQTTQSIQTSLLLTKELQSIINMISDSRSIPALIHLLDDKEYEIRWIAAEGLIRIGRKSVVPLLRSIADGRSISFAVNGSLHVLQNILTNSEKREMERLLSSIGNDPCVAAVAKAEASTALKTLFRRLN